MGCAESCIHVPPGYIAVTYPIHAACPEGIQTRRSCVFGAEAAPLFLPAPFRSHTIPMTQNELDTIAPRVDMQRVFGPITTPITAAAATQVVDDPYYTNASTGSTPAPNNIIDANSIDADSASSCLHTPEPCLPYSNKRISTSPGLITDSAAATTTIVDQAQSNSANPINTSAAAYSQDSSMTYTPNMNTIQAEITPVLSPASSLAARTRTTHIVPGRTGTVTMSTTGCPTASISACAPTCEVRTLFQKKSPFFPVNDSPPTPAMRDTAGVCVHEVPQHSPCTRWLGRSALCRDPTPSPARPGWTGARAPSISIDSQGVCSSTNTSTSSCPQIDCVGIANGPSTYEGTWQWWCEQVRGCCVTHDKHSCTRLLNVPTVLRDQHNRHPHYVEFDVSSCYMLPDACRILATVLASPIIHELRWLTKLNVSDNNFESGAVCDLFVRLARANCKKCVMPVLRELHVAHMNLTTRDVCCIMYCLFPFKPTASSNSRLLLRWLSDVFPLTELNLSSADVGQTVMQQQSDSAAIPARPGETTITELLFPSLCLLDLSNNVTLGNNGLRELLRSMLAVHYEGYNLKCLDLSGCGIDMSGVHLLRTYRMGTMIATRRMCAPVIAQTIVLHGNNISGAPLGNLHTRDTHNAVRFVLE